MTKILHNNCFVAKHVLRYLHRTINFGLQYTVGNIKLHGYTNLDWAGNIVDKKSTSRYYFDLVSAMISWMSRKQKLVALTSAKAKYISTSLVSCKFFLVKKTFWRVI